MTAPSQPLEELRRRLSAGVYDNTRLPPERELAEELKVSRRALRGALDTLESERLIWRRQGHGTFASSQRLIHPSEVARLAHRVSLLEMVEARLAIEPLLIGRSAIRISQAEIDAVTRLAESGRDAKDAKSYEAFDIAFHHKLAECAGNAMLLAMFEMVIDVREKADWRQVREYHFHNDGANQTYIEHMRIVDALKARDAILAEQSMRAHLAHVAQSVLGTDDVLVGSVAN